MGQELVEENKFALSEDVDSGFTFIWGPDSSTLVMLTCECVCNDRGAAALNQSIETGKQEFSFHC